MANLALPIQFVNGGQSTNASSMTNVVTTAVLASTASFGATGNYIVRIDDTGSPGSTKFEYVLVTNNNTGTNTLTFTRGQDGTSAQTFAAGSTFTAYLTAGMLNAAMQQSIASTVLGGVTASVTFSSIPSTFADLQLDYNAQDSGAGTGVDFVLFQLNSDGAANYNSEFIKSTVGAVTGNEQISGTAGQWGILNQGAVASFSGGFIRILNYASTTQARRVAGEVDANTTANEAIYVIGGQWKNAVAAVTTILAKPNANSFAGGCRFALRGTP